MDRESGVEKQGLYGYFTRFDRKNVVSLLHNEGKKRKIRYDDRFHTGREFLYIFRVDMRYLSLPMNSLVCTPYRT